MLHFFFTKYQNYGITETTEYEYDDYGNCSKMTATGSENYVTEYNYNNAQGVYTALLQSMSEGDDENVRYILSGYGRRDDEWELYSTGDYGRDH